VNQESIRISTVRSKLQAEYNNVMTENNNLKARMDAVGAELATIQCMAAVAPNSNNG
jgi:hypothetical protein